MGTDSQKIVGVLMLNTRFPRVRGDIGNPDSFNHPVLYQTIKDATPTTIITDNPVEAALRRDIVNNAKELQQRGASIITTSCGFLTPLQTELSTLLDVPVITSSLVLLPLLNNCYGNGHVGVITFNAEKLQVSHLQNHSPAAIEGLRGHDSLRVTIENDLDSLDIHRAEAEVVDACTRLMQQAPDTRAVILECTNLSPYKHTLRKRFGVSVYDIVDAIHWMLNSQSQ